MSIWDSKGRDMYGCRCEREVVGVKTGSEGVGVKMRE